MATVETLAQAADAKRAQVATLHTAMVDAQAAWERAASEWAAAREELQGMDEAVTNEAIRPGSILR